MSSKNSNMLKRKTVLSMAMMIFCAAVLLRMLPFGDKAPLPTQPTTVYAVSDGDYNHDGEVDIQDLQVFSIKHFDVDWVEIDWCLWLENRGRKPKINNGLIDFIIDYFGCYDPPPDDPLTVKNNLVYPMRLALGPEGNLYVSDNKVGSVFIYDPNFVVIGELKGLDKPLGVAVDSNGNIYVGNSGRKNIEVYNPQGDKTATIGKGLIKMPNDLAFDNNGRLYVADSKNNTIWVFDSNGSVLRSIGTPGDGEGQFKFPLSVTVAYYTDPYGQEIGELYVADRGHSLIQVFDLEGNFLRSFGGMVIEHGFFNKWYEWEGFFVSIQSLAFDDMGQLHALDGYMDKVQILDPGTGEYISSYGENGTGVGQLNLPTDILIDDFGQVIVAEARNKRVEIIYTIPPLP